MNEMTNVSLGAWYIAPEIKAIEMKSEGLLCVSGFDVADDGYNPGFDLGEI
jgi:hypothetical protein